MTSKTACSLALFVSLVSVALGAEALYQNNFEKAETGTLPDEFLVIDGSFVVRQEGTNKFLELPGAPLDSFTALFGPTEKDGIEASGRILGTAKGRRSPAFGMGLNGISGYRLQVSPGKKALEFFRNDISRASVDFEWVSGKWTQLRLQVTKAGAGWKVTGKAWQEGQAEPASWMISIDEPDELPAGRASIYGSPYSTTPIRYDDLVVARVKG